MNSFAVCRRAAALLLFLSTGSCGFAFSMVSYPETPNRLFSFATTKSLRELPHVQTTKSTRPPHAWDATANRRRRPQQCGRGDSLWWALFWTRRSDIEMEFGSSNTSGVNWGDDRLEDDDDDDDDEDGNSPASKLAPKSAEQKRRRALRHRNQRIQELLEESNKEDIQQRKVKKWGKFANVTNRQDLEPLLEEEQKRIEAVNSQKAQLAAATGISYQVLEPREEDLWGMSCDSKTIMEDKGNIQISIGSASNWFTDVDEDLKAEWDALTANDRPDGASGNDRGNKAVDDTKSSSLDDATAVMADSKGNIVTRESMAGIRVGSAGGWTLEVFPGDFVVHRKYGIGRFERTCLRPKTKLTAAEQEARDNRRAEILTRELRRRKRVTPKEIQKIRAVFGTEQDTDPISNPQTTVLEIAYSDAIVHVPVDRAYRLSRYRAGDAAVKPKLSRVKGEAWRKAKQNVQETTLKMAQDVLALYTKREMLTREPFSPTAEPKVREFETTFPFEPTPDQRKCFEDVENDMVWRSRPMDRLVCGDVGFGKTEVALRALFRSVANGRQAALLAPTGVLAAQHFKNVLKRMGPDTPFQVEAALLRGGLGRTSKAGRELREQIAEGKIRLVVGTHALLSNDLKFQDLGLLVVDEEQRFGVKQKERLKLICTGIDVLTLSATPIPRTLQMSLSGIRDTTTIRSPPPMRKPTITYVLDFDEEIVRDAISRELARGGQCYYVVPRISMLEEAQKTIEKLFPKIRIIMAHGRMSRNGAEENVASFAEGNHDILLATTVIENGVDIPSVNTIIVQNSQAFGISTLYQLRGRVGRSDKQAYAYFLHREESLTQQAALRLQAIGELNELGSGFDVANRDLEIRGAGSLLGTEQSGMAEKVGFDLYMRLLKKNIRKLRGLDLPFVPRTNVLLPRALVKGSPDTFSLPPSLVTDDVDRRKQETKARLAESTAALVNLTNTWKNDYGNLPVKVQSDLKVMHLHACTRRLGIDLMGLVPGMRAEAPTEAAGDDEAKQPRVMDCVLRSPGLRPRHVAMILPHLPKNVLPRGIDIVFPRRFATAPVKAQIKGKKFRLIGGRRLNPKLLSDQNDDRGTFDGLDSDDSDWDAMDQEELEAMKEISSAFRVSRVDEVDWSDYPSFVLPNFWTVGDPKGARTSVDRLLKVLLPVAKVVYLCQEAGAEQAKAAADLREKQEMMRERKKALDAIEAQRMNLRY